MPARLSVYVRTHSHLGSIQRQAILWLSFKRPDYTCIKAPARIAKCYIGGCHCRKTDVSRGSIFICIVGKSVQSQGHNLLQQRLPVVFAHVRHPTFQRPLLQVLSCVKFFPHLCRLPGQLLCITGNGSCKIGLGKKCNLSLEAYPKVHYPKLLVYPRFFQYAS